MQFYDLTDKSIDIFKLKLSKKNPLSSSKTLGSINNTSGIFKGVTFIYLIWLLERAEDIVRIDFLKGGLQVFLIAIHRSIPD